MIRKTLGEICDDGGGKVQTGPFGSQLHRSDYSEEGTPVVMPKNIVDGAVSVEGIARVSQEHVARLARHQLQPGDIVYGRRGEIGRCALITERERGWLCGTGCLRITPGNNAEVDSRYLYYQLIQPEKVEWLENHAVGATMANLNTEILRGIPVDFPPVATQRRIAGILSAYDDLIENNTRRIRLLEEMARALYREWFVHYRFPGHEDVAMVEHAELGPVPEGWEVVPMSHVCDILSGGTPKTKISDYWDGNIPFFTPRDAPLSFYVTDTAKHLTKAGLSSCNSSLYPKDTVFITARGTVGKLALAAASMAMNQSCYALRGKDGIDQIFLFMAVSDRVNHLRGQAHGAVFDTIVISTFDNIDTILPPHNVRQYFSKQATPIFNLMLNLTWQIKSLQRTRDLLLPRLISGEIPVEAAEEELEAAA